MRLHTGSVISGTLRTSDLLRAFAHLLALHQHGDNRKLIDEAMNYSHDEPTVPMIMDIHHQLIDELSTKLNELCPPGYFFGAHPDDGADFGVWQVEPEGFAEWYDSQADDSADWLYQFNKEQRGEETDG